MGVCVTEGIEAVAMGVCVTEDIQRPSQSTLVAAQSVIVEDRIYLLGPSVHGDMINARCGHTKTSPKTL